jgi:GTP-binding protein
VPIATIASPTRLRNIAIIAHVDHGKTTLVDSMFRQSGLFGEHDHLAERAMDSNDLEKERGITILSKNTAIPYKDYKINILDTPGHADFSGEVERVLTMVDGALLIVDAVEGPMPQTRFVLRKALSLGLKVLVVINKVDRPAADPERAVDRVLDLFIELGADEHQLDFPVVYACGLQGTSSLNWQAMEDNLESLFNAVLEHIPAPQAEVDEPLQLQISTLDYNEYLGRIIIGRVRRGTVAVGQTITLLPAHTEQKPTNHKVTKLFSFEGLKRIPAEAAMAGDIVALAGLPEADIGDTLCDINTPDALPPIELEEPTLSMVFAVNTSPFAGREGEFVTSRQIKDRLEREVKSNISLRVGPGPSSESFTVSGRGELHLSILIETMRREGYEFHVGQPKVLTKEIEGKLHEPVELVSVDVPEAYTGSIIERMAQRRGDMQTMETHGVRTLLSFKIPSRGLLGFRSEFIRLTRGEGLMSSAFASYEPWYGELNQTRNGAIIANETGDVTAYALKNLEDRGVFFIEPRQKVYKGMIVGEYNRQQDIVVNVCKAKQLTNMRSAGSDVLAVLATPRTITLEVGLEFIAADELMEVTPKSIRLRKADLNVRG